MKLKFPDNFLWGASTSAHQVEGGNRWNDWWKFERELKIERSGRATNHYQLYKQDYQIAKNLKIQAIRLSIEWSRVEKKMGSFDAKEIQHYKEELSYLKNKGFKVMATLHHFTNPVWFNELGSWDKKGNEKYFLKFVEVCGREFSDLVDYWCILNEPWAPYATLGFLTGKWPPQKRNLFSFMRANSNMIKAHNLSYDILKEFSNKPIGTAFNVAPYLPNYLFEYPLKQLVNYLRNWWYLDQIRKRSDYIGINYYSPLRLLKKNGSTDMGWEVNFNGIYQAAIGAWKRYQKPIYITENGAADNEDKIRTNYIKGHLISLHKAIQDGADVRGYFHWSLLDNFEWTSGYSQRFGLIRVDHKTLKRTTNKSARYYSEIIVNNAVTAN